MIAIANPRSPGAIRLPGPSAPPPDEEIAESVRGYESGWMRRLVGPHDQNGVRHTLLICDLFCGAGAFTFPLAQVAPGSNRWVGFFDTAPLYGHGLSERRLGRALSRRSWSRRLGA